MPGSDRSAPVPIFVISYNRRWQLERALASYRQLGDIEVVIHDNGSDAVEVVAYLDELERAGVHVERSGKIASVDDLESVNETIAHYFESRPPAEYVVTDPDIELVGGAEGAIDVYRHLLRANPDVESVGPMLRIDDVPASYPLRTTVLNWHIHQFWRNSPDIVRVGPELVALQRCPIDTTFAMHRAGVPFRRLSRGIRLYGRYAARHLDWYADGPADGVYARTARPEISHWGNERFHAEHSDDELVYRQYLDVEDLESGPRVAIRWVR